MDKLKKIVIVIPKGNLIVSSVAGTYKIFKAAIEDSGKDIELIIAGPKKTQSYLDGYFSIRPQVHWKMISDAHLIIVPALIDNMDEVVKNNTPLIAWLKQQFSNKASIASLCTGSFLLAQAGLLNDRKCTTHWAYSNDFNSKYPEVDFQKNSIITEDNGIFTSGGAYSFLNLIIYLVERYFNKDLARKLTNIFQIDFIRKSQDPFVIFDTQKRHGDQKVVTIQNYIETHFAEPLTNKELSKISQLGEKTLVRRFRKMTGNTPKQYQQRVRMEAAKELLSSTNKQIKEIQFQIGYNDPKFFRSAFLKSTGMLPKAYKQHIVFD